MADPWDWTETSLQQLIALATKESIELDYKACDALAKTDGKKNEISKDVSAFANSAGGTLVYGMIEDGHVPTALDSGFDPTDISKEWLEQVINSRIHRRIDGVRINSVDLEASHPGRVAYVVHVPQSSRAPHQAADKRFYKRFNFESVPMEEYEVRDVARRAETPDLALRLALHGDPPEPLFGTGERSRAVALGAQILNNAAAPADFALIDVFIDSRIYVADWAGMVERPPRSVTRGDVSYLLANRQRAWNSGVKMPIWEGVLFGINDRPIQVAFPRGDGDYLIGWRIRSPRMPEHSGYDKLEVRSGLLALVPVS